MRFAEQAAGAQFASKSRLALWMVGRVDYVHKNNLRGLDVLEALLRGGHDACLSLVGDGKDLADFKAAALERGLSAHLRYTGWSTSPWSHVPEDAIVLIPSITEGMPLVATEAMMRGIRMVVSPIPPFFEGSPHEVIAESFHTVDFAKKVLEVHAMSRDVLASIYATALEKFSEDNFVRSFLASTYDG